MLLSPGTRLGPYEVLAPIGAGGMGEVYRARDTKLNREVALKVLPAAFALDADRMARFEREAQVLASLNHPRIAAIYGLEESGGVRALVMELVEGPMLSERIAQGALPVKEALEIARQIAEALEAAHERGIVHRDLKPANVKFTGEDDQIKVLDFGLAKALEGDPAASSADAANSPTRTMNMATRAGIILGTAAYMSPEQARGKPAGKQADVWAFGVVLYEMLTGRGPFQGESISDTLAAVLKTDPDWSALPRDTPASIRRLLRRCLERDRKRRLRDIGDALVEIDEAQTEPDAPAGFSSVKPSRLWPWAVAGALAIALAVAVALLYQATRPVARPLMRLDVELGPGVVLAGSSPQGGLAISPDGTRVVFRVRGADGKIRLATRLLDRNEVATLAGTEDAASPFFSPNGQWIAFATPGKLKKIAAEGGAPVTLCEFPSVFLGGSWGDDGNIIAALGLSRGLSRIPSAGGAPAPVTKLRQEKREFRHSWPQVLPGSQAVLFTAHFGGLEEANIEILSLKTGERKTLQRGSFFGRYVANPNGAGHLVYLQQNTLFAAPFDLSRLALAGDPQPVVQDINNSRDAGADFAFSQTGSAVYLSGRGDSQQSIFWLDSAGKTQPLHAAPGMYSFPRFSPDGTRLAFMLDDGQGNRDIWVQNLERDTRLRVTTMPGPNIAPVWTPDGRNIFYLSDNPAAPGIYSVRADGAGEARRLTDGKIRSYPSSLSPDGKWLAIFGASQTGDVQVHMLTAPIEGSPDEKRLGTAEPILRSPFITIFPVFSPDGHWLAYQSNQSATREVYVRPFPGPGGGQQISSGGGWFPVWSSKGRELFFRGADSRIMVVDYTASGDSFVSGKPRVWSEHRLLELVSPPTPTYDLAPNGKRFAVVLYSDGTADQKPVTHLTFLLNFFDELRRRAPAAGN